MDGPRHGRGTAAAPGAARGIRCAWQRPPATVRTWVARVDASGAWSGVSEVAHVAHKEMWGPASVTASKGRAPVRGHARPSTS